MLRALTICVFVAGLAGCAPAKVTEQEVSRVAGTLDYGDYSSTTLAVKGWEALEANDHAAVIAYTSKCVELYGERGREMNDGLNLFPPVEKVNQYWALNDVGTCLFIMGTSYEKQKMYPQAAQAFASLEKDYNFSQCWDPKGWYWQPATAVAGKAARYATK